MIKLADILFEGSYEIPGRRVSMGRLLVIMEKLVPTLSTEKRNKIEELCAKISEGITEVNETRYSLSNADDYKHLLRKTVTEPAAELREELNELLKNKSLKVNIRCVEQAITTIDELYSRPE